MKTRIWCFTNFDLNFDYQKLFDKGTIKYLGYGLEECPTTKKAHHQGFVYFNSPRGSSKQVAKDFNNAHVEPCVGSLESNEKYCSKESSLITLGVKPEQGARTDLTDVKNEIINGKSVEEICIDKPHLYHQYGRTLTKIEDICLRKRLEHGRQLVIGYMEKRVPENRNTRLKILILKLIIEYLMITVGGMDIQDNP